MPSPPLAPDDGPIDVDHLVRMTLGDIGLEHEVLAMFDETFVRAWRLYLTGSQASFSTGSLQLFQVVFARGNTAAAPFSRIAG